MTDQIDYTRLHDLISARFNDNELRALCFEINIDYDILAGDEKSAKIRELLLYVRRRERLEDLINGIVRTRPDIDLSDLSISSDHVIQSNYSSPNTQEINTSSSKESPQNKVNGMDQPLRPLTYIFVSAAALLISIGLLLFMVFLGPRLLQQGMNQQVFYFLLIPLGLSTAAFVFGGMRSYATINHRGSYGTFTATGPIVVAILVVIGGFYLIPTQNDFDVTIRVITPAGPLRTGEVVLIAGASTIQQPINTNGEAVFKSLPLSLVDTTARISVWTDTEIRLIEVERMLADGVIEIDVALPPPTPTPSPTPLPEQSFNIAVAEFTMRDGSGAMTMSPVSEEFSSWLFNSIDTEARNLLDTLSFQTRGPDHIEPIFGTDEPTRMINAASIANDNNATILVYGFIEESEGEGAYSVSIEFYVSEEGFNYGSEIAGADRLGKPINFTFPINNTNQSDINDDLYGRTIALTHIVEGLGKFHLGRYEIAAADFNWAATRVQDWEEDEGKEVAYLLEGAAWLRAYDPCTDPEYLSDALTAFENASQLNNEYARNYLGLAAVKIEQAIQYDENCNITAVDDAILITAESDYLESLRLDGLNPTESAFIPVKASFGLGQIYLLRYEHVMTTEEEWREAQAAFEQVIENFNAHDQPIDLAWFAANAHAHLGRLLGHINEWELMIDEMSQAIEILNRLPGNYIRGWEARYLSWIGLAQSRLMENEAAIRSYEQAIEAGSGNGYVANTELDAWRDKIAQLMEEDTQ